MIKVILRNTPYIGEFKVSPKSQTTRVHSPSPPGEQLDHLAVQKAITDQKDADNVKTQIPLTDELILVSGRITPRGKTSCDLTNGTFINISHRRFGKSPELPQIGVQFFVVAGYRSDNYCF